MCPNGRGSLFGPAATSFTDTSEDALLIAAACSVGCTFFLSEDLQPGRKFGQMEVIDPFSRAPKEVLGA